MVLQAIVAGHWLKLGEDFRPEIQLPLLLISGLITLVIALAILVAAFYLFDLTDKTKPFGVPEGTLQVVIALTLILIFAIASLYLRGSLNPEVVTIDGLTSTQVEDIPGDEILARIAREDGLFKVQRLVPVDQDAKDFSNQLLTILGTLVGAVAGFYFGAKSVEAGVTAGGANVGPTNTSLPEIKGQPHVGETLRAESGGWTGSPAPSYSYKWQRKRPADTEWSDIAGATKSSYTVTPEDAGYTIRLVVTATNSVGEETANSMPTDEVARAPTATSPPAITGTASEGALLSASRGDWVFHPEPAFSYEWQRSDRERDEWVPIPEARAQTYQVVRDDVGKRLRVVVTAANPAGTASEPSLPTEPALGLQANTTSPTISPTVDVREGMTLTASPGDWSGWPLSYSFQWQSAPPATESWKDIPDARESVYRSTRDDVNRRIRVAVSVGTALPVFSPPTGVVLAASEEPIP